MGTYFQEELERKGLKDYIPQMEATMAEREGYRDLKCWECFYSMFGKCPAGGSRNNAACLTMRKSYMEMPKKMLIETAEAEYKDSLTRAAKMYNARMSMIKNMFPEQEEENDE